MSENLGRRVWVIPGGLRPGREHRAGTPWMNSRWPREWSWRRRCTLAAGRP